MSRAETYSSAWWLGTLYAQQFPDDLDKACLEQALFLASCDEDIETVRCNCGGKIYEAALAIKTALVLQGLLALKHNPDPLFPGASGKFTASFVKKDKTKDLEREFFKPEDIRPVGSDGKPLVPSLGDLLEDLIDKCTPPPVLMGVLGYGHGHTQGCGCNGAKVIVAKYPRLFNPEEANPMQKTRRVHRKKPQCGDDCPCRTLSHECIQKLTKWSGGTVASVGETWPEEAKYSGAVHYSTALKKVEEWDEDKNCPSPVSCPWQGMWVWLEDCTTATLVEITQTGEQVWTVQPTPFSEKGAADLTAIQEDLADCKARLEKLEAAIAV